jgi:hypothetical protein
MTKEECEIETSKAIMEMRKHISELEKENAGLKAGRPKWHKVTDGYLPKDNRLVLIRMVNGNTTMGIFYVNAWREICNCKELTGVMEWCEIPKE